MQITKNEQTPKMDKTFVEKADGRKFIRQIEYGAIRWYEDVAEVDGHENYSLISDNAEADEIEREFMRFLLD